LSSPHLEASPTVTFHACSSPAPTPVKPQPAPAILSQESVHTMLSITHQIRKLPSIGPRTTNGSQSPTWWVHWQHTRFGNQRQNEKKRNDSKKLQQAIESQRRQTARSLEEDKSQTL
jgi:negative regulator of sigma E activity